MAVTTVNVHAIPTEAYQPVQSISVLTLEQTRQALATYFMFSTADGSDLPNAIILSILLAKKEAIKRNDQRFERLMLDVGKYCDERLDDENNAGKTGRKNFHRLVDILHRMEEASQFINKMVFFARGIPDGDTLNALSSSWNELNSIKPGLFRELLLDDLLASDLPGRMGRKRITNILEGLECLSNGTGTMQDIHLRLERVEREEQILVSIVTCIQETIGSRYGLLAGDGERDTIKRIVSIELRHKRLLSGDIPDNLFDVGLRLAKSSLMYMNTLLPIIFSQADAGLREEFIRDSGLDRLLVEELEEFWCSRENLPPHRLDSIRSRS
jgi:uncharacterized protein (TIGR04442 family)